MSFSLEFEDGHALVVAGCKVVLGGVTCKDPVSVGVFSGLLDLSSPLQVPETQRFVL